MATKSSPIRRVYIPRAMCRGYQDPNGGRWVKSLRAVLALLGERKMMPAVIVRKDGSRRAYFVKAQP